MGKRKAGEVLLALDERMTRCRHVIKTSGKTKEGVRKELEILRHQYGSLFPKVFRSITSDNGSEFSGLSKLFKEGKVYFAHPYSSGERGTNEKHNSLVRRFIPKGQPIDEITDDELIQINWYLNCRPLKCLNWRTPIEIFLRNLRY